MKMDNKPPQNMPQKPDRANQNLFHTPQSRQKLAILSRHLGYEFNNPNLLIQALTHRSFDSVNSYERLEFLGDALLSMVIAEALYHQYLDKDEGKLTRMRATLVRQETLAQIALKLDLPNHLILGVGERKGGGRNRASILSDVVESLIGAIYLDSGKIDTVKTCILTWYGDLIDQINDQKFLKDAKSRLQEWLQSKQYALPLYELIETRGNAPNQTFVVRCQVTLAGCQPVIQSGESRRIAEQKSATIMLDQIQQLLNEGKLS